MGHYRLVIEGTGIHHNTPPAFFDADQQLVDLARKLKASGHSLNSVRFEMRPTHTSIEITHSTELLPVVNESPLERIAREANLTPLDPNV